MKSCQVIAGYLSAVSQNNTDIRSLPAQDDEMDMTAIPAFYKAVRCQCDWICARDILLRFGL